MPAEQSLVQGRCFRTLVGLGLSLGSVDRAVGFGRLPWWKGQCFCQHFGGH